ncbi:conserved hypothetical protein [Culex quinquefasciatus]|uniref:SNF2 N-terminal domain-containing protein n=1 Tax=Culex quinquefasciatus TaxID=7176 RepID=B0X1T9_CULQU|nr:conserved hypothetical protein [Culex quinquefasciatus]|eukprot:XP_001863611.1 conserved hypothetical protein [Culex quinquefasciatus]
MKRFLPAELPPPPTIRPQALPDPGMLELLTSLKNHARVNPAALHTPAEPTTTQVRFKLCWGKITTKKHKTWEGDGTLTIVGGKSVTLRDEDGKVIGCSGLVKGEELEKGSRLIVGSKEVELEEPRVERIDGENDVPEGVSFLYECVFGMKREDSEQFGAILADEMGLGKTLQTLALIYTLMKQGPYGQPIMKRVLIVTPSSLVDNIKIAEVLDGIDCRKISFPPPKDSLPGNRRSQPFRPKVSCSSVRQPQQQQQHSQSNRGEDKFVALFRSKSHRRRRRRRWPPSKKKENQGKKVRTDGFFTQEKPPEIVSPPSPVLASVSSPARSQHSVDGMWFHVVPVGEKGAKHLLEQPEANAGLPDPGGSAASIRVQPDHLIWLYLVNMVNVMSASIHQSGLQSFVSST